MNNSYQTLHKRQHGALATHDVFDAWPTQFVRVGIAGVIGAFVSRCHGLTILVIEFPIGYVRA